MQKYLPQPTRNLQRYIHCTYFIETVSACPHFTCNVNTKADRSINIMITVVLVVASYTHYQATVRQVLDLRHVHAGRGIAVR